MKSPKRREIISLIFTCLCITKSLLIENVVISIWDFKWFQISVAFCIQEFYNAEINPTQLQDRKKARWANETIHRKYFNQTMETGKNYPYRTSNFFVRARMKCSISVRLFFICVIIVLHVILFRIIIFWWFQTNKEDSQMKSIWYIFGWVSVSITVLMFWYVSIFKVNANQWAMTKGSKPSGTWVRN